MGAIYLCALLYDRGLWSAIWNGELPHGWDGSGGYSVAKLYADWVFPDTFGWLPQFAAGTPFPNYYPPLFQWLVAALTRWAGLPFGIAFRGVLAAAALSVPVGIWYMARAATRRRSVAILAAMAAFPLLFDQRSYYPLGIGYPSTFLVGLYAQTLGFCCAALWYACFSRARRPAAWLVSSLVLGTVFLSSFFASTLVAMLWATTAAHTCFRAIRAPSAKGRGRLRRIAAWQLLTFLIGLALAASWLVPMLAERAFLVTRPTQASGSELTNPLLFVWYALGAAGVVVWLRRPTSGLIPVCWTAALGYLAVLWANRHPSLLPWFPLQVPRVLSTLNLLVAVPAGVAVTQAMKAAFQRARIRLNWRSTAFGLAAGAALLLAARPFIETPDYRLAFYSPTNGDFQRVAPILRFAETHREGMYIVEQVPMNAVGPALDARAISAYLGTQGNQSAGFVFLEAPLSSLLLTPLAGALSSGQDPWGLSSMLADDVNFLRQDTETHVGQAEEYRARYFVLVTNAAKERFSRVAPQAYVRHDFGVWSVFESTAPARQEAAVLADKPVLVLTSFSAKLTRQSDYNFLRLAEEEFMRSPRLGLAFRPEFRTDTLPDPGMFSGLVVESYSCGNEQAAFSGIQRFSREKPVVLIESDAPLFRTLRGRRSELGQVAIVPRATPWGDRWIGLGRPVVYRLDPVRTTWEKARESLLALMPPSPASPTAKCQVTWTPNAQRIQCDSGDGSQGPVAVKLNASFHPNWQRDDGKPILMASPSLMYTVVQGVAELRFRRTADERAALCFSAIVLAAIAAFLIRDRWKRHFSTPSHPDSR